VNVVLESFGSILRASDYCASRRWLAKHHRDRGRLTGEEERKESPGAVSRQNKSESTGLLAVRKR